MYLLNDMVETENLIIRRFMKEDLKDFYEYARVVDVGLQGGWESHKTISDSKIVLEKFIVLDTEYAIVCKQNNKCIGSMSIHPFKSDEHNGLLTDSHIEIGYALSKNYWGNGLVPEAVTAVLAELKRNGFRKIVCCHKLENNQSKRVIEKCGFEKVGIVEKYLNKRINEYVTLCVYSV